LPHLIDDAPLVAGQSAVILKIGRQGLNNPGGSHNAAQPNNDENESQ
jgi:hypothetical protein